MQKLLIIAVCILLASHASAQPFEASFRSTSLVKRTTAGGRQLIETHIATGDSLDAVTVEMRVTGREEPVVAHIGAIPRGQSRRFFEIPVSQKSDSALLLFIVKGKRVYTSRGFVTPPRKWRIYDVQVSHHDLGYADYYHLMRRDVREMGIEMALDFCRKTDSWAPTDQFRWTVETSEPMTKFISSQPPEVLRELADRIREGRIALGGLHNSVYAEMMGYEAMARLFYTPNRHISDLLGIPPARTALITDVVGFPRTLPTFLKEADIPYFYHGYNETVNGMFPASAEPVFYWKAHDGDAETMPLFRSYPYYSPDRLTKYDTPEISGVLAKYERGGLWPYNCLIAEDSYDFSVPQFENVEGIRRWNSLYENPVLVSGTFTMFFDDVVRQADTSKIRMFDQDAPNAWADQDGSDGRLMADARLLNYDLPATEKLATTAYASGGKGYPWMDIWQAYHKLLSYHEHTNGAFSEEDVRPIPFQKNPRAANANYYECEQVMHKGLITEAQDLSRTARTHAIEQFKALISTEDDSTLVVFNSLSHQRSGYGGLPWRPAAGMAIIDNTTGHNVPFQEMPDGQVQFFAADVPAMGYKTFRVVRRTPETVAGELRPAMAQSRGAENQFYSVQIDDSTGAISSIRDKRRNLELVDQTSAFRFNQYLYLRLDEAFSRKPTPYSPRMVSCRYFDGPLASGITTLVAAQGCQSIRQSVILYKHSDRIDFIVDLQKSESGRLLKQPTAQNKEAVFYVLPLNVPGFTIRHELPGGVLEPLANQFQGSTSNYFGIQHFSDFSNTKYGVTLSSHNAPLVVYGSPRAALWLAPSDAEFSARKPEKSHVALYLMNNMFFTNIPLSQPGQSTFRWSIRAHDGDWVKGKAYTFGWETSHLLECFLIERKLTRSLPPLKHSFMSISDDNVICSTLKPAEANGKGFIFRFFELTGRATTVRVRLPIFHRIERAIETNLVEVDRESTIAVADGNTLTFSIRPFGIKTIRVIPEQQDALPAPAGVRTRAISDREVGVSWQATKDNRTSFFRVYRGTTADFVPSLVNCVGTSTAPEFVDRPTLNSGGWLDNNLDPSTAYYYRVQSVGSLNTQSIPSPPVRALTLSSREGNSPPNKVLGLAVTSVSPITSFNYLCLLFYRNVEPDVTRYRIYRGTAPGFRPDNTHLLFDMDAREKFAHVIPHEFATVTRELRDYTMIIYPDESARPNRRYYYRVCAVDESGQEGESSDEVSGISEITRLTFSGSMFFFDSTRVDIHPVLDDGSTIRFSTDGSPPGLGSRIYTGPFSIMQPAKVRAALFYPGQATPAATGEAHYMRSLFPPPRYLQPYSDKWPGQGPLNMVDGKRGGLYFDSYFQGFELNDMDVVIDLGGKRTIQEVQVTMLQDIRAWIFFPEHVEFFISHDGANFERVGEVRTVNENERKEGTFLQDFAVTLESRSANFVRVRAKNVGKCPPWHAGFAYNGKAWVFADEIRIR